MSGGRYSSLANLTSLDVAVMNYALQEIGFALDNPMVPADTNIVTTDVTTNDATTTKHGFMPKLSGNALHFLRGDGTFAAGVVVLNKTPADGTGTGNSANETESFSYTVPGGTLSTDGRIRLTFMVKARAHTGFSRHLTLRVKFGGTTIITAATTDSGNAIGETYVEFLFAVDIFADDSASAQLAYAFVSGNAAYFGESYLGSAAVDSSADQSLIVTLEWASTSGANQDAFVKWTNVALET